MWAEPLGGDRYRLRNSPFYARGFSFLDVVIAETRAHGFPIVRCALFRSGHSTYQLFVREGIDGSVQFRSYAERLVALNCTFERATGQMVAVDVPPAANVHEVYSVLEAGEHAGVWGFQEGHCGHPVRPREYIDRIQATVWRIEPSIGFDGFVIGSAMRLETGEPASA